MNPLLVFAKTPAGDEALQQGTRLVQRNLRMVLLQVDGQLTVSELADKIGNQQLVESALLELENNGYIVASMEVASLSRNDFSESSGITYSSINNSASLSGFSGFDPISLTPNQPEKPVPSTKALGDFPDTQILAEPDDVPVASVAPPVVEQAGESASIDAAAWLKRIFLGGVLVVVLLLAGVFFYPYQQFKPAIEANLSRLLGEEVTVDKVSFVPFPEPQLRIGGVRIGDESSIDEISLRSPLSFLNKNEVLVNIPLVDIRGASLSTLDLLKFPLLTPDAEADPKYLVRRVRISHLRLNLTKNFQLNNLEGDFLFQEDGSFEKAAIGSADRQLKVGVTPDQQGLLLDIEGREWKPEGVPAAFGLFQANGLLQEERLTLQNIDTSFLDGIVRGKWTLDWSSGMPAMAGELVVQRLDSRKIGSALIPLLKLEGELSASGKFRSQAPDWAGLWESVEAAFDVDVVQGVLHGADPVEAARRGDTETRAGSTRFQRLQAAVSVTPKQINLKNVRLSAGAVNGVGQFTVNREAQVDGHMDVTVQTSVASQYTPVRIYGTLPELTAVSKK